MTKTLEEHYEITLKAYNKIREKIEEKKLREDLTFTAIECLHIRHALITAIVQTENFLKEEQEGS